MNKQSIQASWVNGVPCPTISVQDRAIQYGDGLFETLPVNHGTIAYLDRHLKRLANGAKRLSFPDIDTVQLRQELLAAAEDYEQAVLKLILTRGSSQRGYAIPKEPEPTRILYRTAAPAYPDDLRQNGVILRLCDTRLSRQPLLAGIKHLNRLEQVLGRNEWSDRHIFDGVMCDTEGSMIETTMCNVFWVSDGELFTPDLSYAGVAGIIRGRILELAKTEKMTINIINAPIDVLSVADEVFLCNSLIGVLPVQRFEDITYPVDSVARHYSTQIKDEMSAS